MMMGRQLNDQAQFFYAFHLEDRVPTSHLLCRIDVFVTQALAGIHREIAAFYSHTGRPSIDPELMMRMLIVGYCCGIRSERKLCEEVSLHLADRWFCRLDLDDAVPDHPTFSKYRHGRFRDSDLLRLVFERVVGLCLAAGLIKGEGFAVVATVIEADARGVARGVDIAGDKTIVKSAASTRRGGDVTLVGFVSGFGGGLPPIDILSRSLTIAGTAIGPRENFEALLAAMAMHEVRPVIDQVFPFAEYREAYRRIASGNHVGKVVIDVAH
jgi:transposase